jgi:peptidoglycan/xylan/chitin deacetylase (PgdA/CDA1 family)
MKMPGFLKRRLGPRLPLSAYRLMFGHIPVGLVYHIVSEASLPYVRHLYAYKTPDMFERDLRYLADHFHVISYPQLVDGLQGKARLRPGSVIITFDDGYRECYTVARPLLKKHGLPALFFITTDFIDNQRSFYRNKVSWLVDAVGSLPEAGLARLLAETAAMHGLRSPDRAAFVEWLKSRQLADEATIDQVGAAAGLDWASLFAECRPFMTTAELTALVADGFSLGAHSRAHPLLAELSPAEIEAEMVVSCQIIGRLTGQASVPFAFPYSSNGLDWQMLAAVQQNHAEVGPLFDARGIQASRPNVINRVWADPPGGSTATESNVGGLLHRSYRRYLLSPRE